MKTSVHKHRYSGFTIMEIMLVIMILGLLAIAIYTVTGPYMARSRDTSRMVRVDTLANVFDAYKKSADKFPSQFGSGGSPITPGYCITEILSRTDGTTVDTKFTTLAKGIQIAPTDPLGRNARPIGPCDFSGSYFYSILSDGINDETAILAARLENQSSANYGTGANLSSGAMAQYFFLNSKKGVVQSSAPDAIYFHPIR